MQQQQLRPTRLRPFGGANIPVIKDASKLRIPSLQTIEIPKKFIPFWDPESHVRDLKLSGIDTTDLEKQYEEFPPVIDIGFKKKPPLVLNFEPILALQAKYSKPARKPPLDERVKALHSCGYPMDVLFRIMKNDERTKAESDNLDKFIFSIFGDASEKKATSVKKKTLHQLLKIKKRVFAMPDADDIEENAVDDEDVLVDADED
jgi:hypothetical protein